MRLAWTKFVESGTYNAEQNYCYALFEYKALICGLNSGILPKYSLNSAKNIVVQLPPPGKQHKKDTFVSKRTFIVLSHFNLLGPGMTYSKVFAGGASTTPTAL